MSMSYLPLLVTIISLVSSLNLPHSSLSSRWTLSLCSVGSPLSRPPDNSWSTAFRRWFISNWFAFISGILALYEVTEIVRFSNRVPFATGGKNGMVFNEWVESGLGWCQNGHLMTRLLDRVLIIPVGRKFRSIRWGYRFRVKSCSSGEQTQCPPACVDRRRKENDRSKQIK